MMKISSKYQIKVSELRDMFIDSVMLLDFYVCCIILILPSRCLILLLNPFSYPTVITLLYRMLANSLFLVLFSQCYI